jgi:hypothetical protein
VRLAPTHGDAIVIIGSSGETELALFVRILSAAPDSASDFHSAAQGDATGSALP